jgi:ubiquinone/menaquinone biosynthesis C-methylase UbiE/glycosyltransferase involved in cell wall biosynthesis
MTAGTPPLDSRMGAVTWGKRTMGTLRHSHTTSDVPKFTGERLIPDQADLALEMEHVTRYLYAASLLTKGRILDDGCGAGYGSAILARPGVQVIGVDISSEAIEHCRRRHETRGIEFYEMDSTRLTFPDEYFDGVVSFEVAEHIAEYEAYIRETQRVLRPGGALIISTPNKRTYRDATGHVNPFHAHEFYPDEFRQLLGQYFEHVQLNIQAYVPSIFIGLPGDIQQSLNASWPQIRQSIMPSKETFLWRSDYVIAVCRKGDLSEKPASWPGCVFALADHIGQPTLSLYLRVKEQEQLALALRGQVAEQEQLALALRGQVAEQEQAVQSLLAQAAEKDQVASALSAQLAEKEQRMLALERQALEKEQAAQSFAARAAEQEQTLDALATRWRERQELAEALKAQVIEQAQTLHEARAQLAEKSQTLDAIYRSKHWKLMAHYWSARQQILRPYWAFREWLRAMIPYETRRRILRLLGRPHGAEIPSRSLQTATATVESPSSTPREIPLNSEQERAFALLLDKLELKISPDVLGQQLGQVMAETDTTNLLALLDFMIANPSKASQPPGVSIVRGMDLPPAQNMQAQRRNILFISGEFPNPVHAGGGRLFDFIRSLSKDNNIYLYTWYSEERDSAARQALLKYCRGIRGVSIQEFESGNRKGLKEFIAGIPMDIVHYEWPRALINYDRGLGKRHIFTYQEAISLRLLGDMAFEPLLSARWLRLMIELINILKVEVVDAFNMDACVALTSKDGEFLTRFGSKGSLVIVNTGINLDDFCLPDTSPEQHTLTFVGNYLHYPNEDAVRFFFDQVFDLIKTQVPDVKVYIVGANPTNRVKAYHDNTQVFVTGTVDDIRPYIQKASVCIAPLISGAGFRGKVNQYTALQRVCVATSIAATDLVYKDGQDIFVADDPAVFAERVVYLLQNPDVAQRMAKAACEKARLHYDLGRAIEGLLRLYDHIESDPTKCAT